VRALQLLMTYYLKITNSIFEKLHSIEQESQKESSITEIENRNMQLLILNNTIAKLSRYLEIINNARTEMNVWSLVNQSKV